MGRSRSGLTTKIHALVDACGLPIALKLTDGQAHDGRSAQDMLGTLDAGQVLLADRAYDSDALRETLAERGTWTNIRPMVGRKNSPAFSPFLFRYRNPVERFFNKLKHFRAIVTRYDKTQKTSSLPSNSLQPEFGCDLMRLSPTLPGARVYATPH
jgi:transposase